MKILFIWVVKQPQDRNLTKDWQGVGTAKLCTLRHGCQNSPCFSILRSQPVGSSTNASSTCALWGRGPKQGDPTNTPPLLSAQHPLLALRERLSLGKRGAGAVGSYPPASPPSSEAAQN